MRSQRCFPPSILLSLHPSGSPFLLPSLLPSLYPFLPSSIHPTVPSSLPPLVPPAIHLSICSSIFPECCPGGRWRTTVSLCLCL